MAAAPEFKWRMKLLISINPLVHGMPYDRIDSQILRKEPQMLYKTIVYCTIIESRY